MYQIQEYTYKRARELGVEVKPSRLKNKKIDVIKNGKRICSIGDINYNDYYSYLRKFGESVARDKRRLYLARHSNNATIKGSCGYYSAQLLWNA
jgi:hypothetical protein